MDSFGRELTDLLPRLRRFARSLTHSPDDADDLVQTSLERALARRDSFTPGTRLDSWMYTLMRNVWIDEARARQRRGRHLAIDADPEAARDPTAGDLDTRLAGSAVQQALARLPDDQRLAVSLVLVEGLSYREAAEVMGTPMGTLTSRLARGRMALMDELHGLGG